MPDEVSMFAVQSPNPLLISEAGGWKHRSLPSFQALSGITWDNFFKVKTVYLNHIYLVVKDLRIGE